MNGSYTLPKLNYDLPLDLDLNESEKFLSEILDELNENLEKGEFISEEKGPAIRFIGSLVKRDDGKYGDIVLLKGHLDVDFITFDIKTGTPMIDHLSVEVNAVFLEEYLCEKYQLQEEVSLYVDQGEYDLYYYRSKKVDVSSVLHEYIFLNKNPYPSESESNE